MIIGCHWILLAQAWIWNNLHLPNKLEPPKKRRTWLSAAVLAGKCGPTSSCCDGVQTRCLACALILKIATPFCSFCLPTMKSWDNSPECVLNPSGLLRQWVHTCVSEASWTSCCIVIVIAPFLVRLQTTYLKHPKSSKNGNVHRWRTCWHISCQLLNSSILVHAKRITTRIGCLSLLAVVPQRFVRNTVLRSTMMSNSAASPNPTQSCAERLKSNWTKRQKWRPTATCLFWPTQCAQLFISALSDFMWLDSLYPCCSLDTHNMEMLSGRLCNLCQPFVSCGSPSTAETEMNDHAVKPYQQSNFFARTHSGANPNILICNLHILSFLFIFFIFLTLTWPTWCSQKLLVTLSQMSQSFPCDWWSARTLMPNSPGYGVAGPTSWPSVQRRKANIANGKDAEEQSAWNGRTVAACSVPWDWNIAHLHAPTCDLRYAQVFKPR